MLKSLGGRIFFIEIKKRKTWRINRECWPASICSSNSSLFHCLFFSSNWNWLSYEMNIINAALSPPVAASDWAQHSPNYQRGTHQRWPAAASYRQLCSRVCTCVHMHPTSNHRFQMGGREKKRKRKNGDGASKQHENDLSHPHTLASRCCVSQWQSHWCVPH